MSKPDKKQKIMQAAEKLFENRRFHEVTLDMVAQAAMVGKGTIYRYFNDKEDLFFQTATSGFSDLCELLSREFPGDALFHDRLLEACIRITDFFDRRRHLTRMMQTEEGRLIWSRGTLWERWRAQRAKLVTAIADILRQGKSEGKIRDDVSEEVLAAFLLGMIRTRAYDLAEAPEQLRSPEMLLDIFMSGSNGRKRE